LVGITISMERLIVSGAVKIASECHKLLTVGGNADHTVDICIFQHLGRVEEMVFAARRIYASEVLGVVILSVCLSVTRVLCD